MIPSLNSRNLDVYITKLRSYIRDDDSVEIITIKGIGYRFVMEWWQWAMGNGQWAMGNRQ